LAKAPADEVKAHHDEKVPPGRWVYSVMAESKEGRRSRASGAIEVLVPDASRPAVPTWKVLSVKDGTTTVEVGPSEHWVFFEAKAAAEWRRLPGQVSPLDSTRSVTVATQQPIRLRSQTMSGSLSPPPQDVDVVG
jgi:hypothetical protein